MSKKLMSVWIGYDPREAEAFAVCRQSIRNFNRHGIVRGVLLRKLQDQGLYNRPTSFRLGKMWDHISDAHMSTEFSISRFLVPHLAKDYLPGIPWAVFIDCDTMFRASTTELAACLDDTKALCCVKHDHRPTNTEKMDGQVQTVYPRKNWSSVMAFNLKHPSNEKLTVEMVNTVPGRDLHRFCWLEDDEIGEIPQEWNYLVGHTENVSDPKLVHFTEGGPWLTAFKEVEFAGEWFTERDRWAH